ncbi:MTH1187 family thiamine-binding protein [Tepidibacter hydrothermalis]|uniref:MTH1187 family thiamine-binding protein n=1 Tax=Tepidibacter hydrothermalis TaxID=3036126 RepID=A0ABY8EDJ2_9FIRM|nr:MTH1187 family thiamine-binding protein [Tepidibacter hydrothermalis]WFD11002.1 MTH1187 family thiamine-binding protein [Tepidibacter hydrothermalis]
MALVEVTIVPLGSESTSLSSYVADVHKVLEREKGLKHMLTPMGTIIEGDLDLIFSTIKQMHESVFENGAMRVSTSIKIDDRRDKVGSMKQKIESVESKLK